MIVQSLGLATQRQAKEQTSQNIGQQFVD